MANDDLLNPLLDARLKGWPLHAPALRRSEVGAQGWNLLTGDLPLPLATVQAAPLAHNLSWMQRFCTERALVLAPHGKTTLSPQLFARQLQAGAWGLTVATAAQAQLAAASGAQQVLVANQVLQAQELRVLAALQAQGLRVLFLLDSLAQLALVEAAELGAALEVLIELGIAGGRTGCRTHEQAMTLARAAKASKGVHLAGLECYEGLQATGDDGQDTAHAQALMQRLQAVALQCEAEALFSTAREGDALVFSAGGSAIYDLVAPGLRLPLSRPCVGVLRSGCYLTHDQGHYRRYMAAVNRRIGCAQASGLQAALQVWALVQSVPEPGLALLNAGRRDMGEDAGMPIPVAHAPAGTRKVAPAPEGWRIRGLNDQHAHLLCPGCEPRVGDRVALGISHPCTTFDKWRWMAVVNEELDVVDAITTCF